MLDEFIDFVSEIFPCISPDVKYKAKDAVLQFEKEGHQQKFLMMTPLKKLSQGDIISNVPFARFSKDGTQKYFIADAIILSTSCHIDNKKYITLAPIFNLDTFDGDKEQLKKNKIYDYIYLPNGYMIDKYVNLEIMTTYDKLLIEKGINSKKLKRITSLSQLGYYFFIVKLTVFLMRKEDEDTLEERSI